MRWCFDTSGFMEPWIRLYPTDLFPAIWDKLQELVSDGAVCAPQEVRMELMKQKDDLLAWADGCKNLFPLYDQATLLQAKHIINTFPGLMKVDSLRSGADPWVVAMARVRGVPVVTYETRGKKGGAPKIPDVCDQLGVNVVSMVDVLRAEGF